MCLCITKYGNVGGAIKGHGRLSNALPSFLFCGLMQLHMFTVLEVTYGMNMDKYDDDDNNVVGAWCILILITH